MGTAISSESVSTCSLLASTSSSPRYTLTGRHGGRTSLRGHLGENKLQIDKQQKSDLGFVKNPKMMV